ncbi:unnamed protein product [Spirodela intermedia]|uniref:Peptidase A1 domain-containing protein n=1 Tax=Spirodela intermedia TaxID=51605 RepID=A0A7I8IM19_SPIIN|nr:unnamed protein product [Spirodela intermedia]CAA6658917.1 unnamed protein product [Spirodela intermedia]
MEPQVTGVVIISLPPPGDPSKGKTITAFALPDDPGDFLLHPEWQQRSIDVMAPPPAAAAAPVFPPSARWVSPRRAAVCVLGASMMVFAIWACLYSEAPFEFLRSSEERDRRRRDGESLLLPLFPKPGGPRFLNQGEVKLGSATGGRQVRMAVSSAAANSSAAFPIRGNIFPDGLYYTSIRVGNPPREYFLDVDTGSDLTWIQCDAPCQSCAKGPNPLYKPRKESIVPAGDSLCLELQRNQRAAPHDSSRQCDYEIAYADHSSSVGVLARDELRLEMAGGKQVRPSFVFGCAYDQQGQLSASPAKTDGILGLTGAKVSFPSQLSEQGLIANVVGHCIKNGGGGHLFLGVDFVPRRGMTWVAMADSPTYASSSSSPQSGGAIFDTGSSYTYFTNEAYGDLLSSLKDTYPRLVRDESDQTLPVCWRAASPIRSVKHVRQFFSPLTLHFESKWWIMPRVLRIPPEGYLILNDLGNVCLGILNGTEVHDGSTTILGDISLRGQLVVYDNVERRIGWVQSDCRKPQRAADFPFL